MAFLPPAQTLELASWCLTSDQEVRGDLIRGYIKSENDYTSNFTGALRRNINTYSTTGLTATSYFLDAADERVMGCDAAIIIQRGDEGKVLLIEAKWPRLTDPSHRWDFRQTAKGQSHFSDQLERQTNYASRYAIIEMFYAEQPFGTEPVGMQPGWSSCVLHDEAVAFDASRRHPSSVWTQAELLAMLAKGTRSIGDIAFDLGACNIGKRMPMGSAERINFSEFPLPGNVLVIAAAKDDSGPDPRRE